MGIQYFYSSTKVYTPCIHMSFKTCLKTFYIRLASSSYRHSPILASQSCSRPVMMTSRSCRLRSHSHGIHVWYSYLPTCTIRIKPNVGKYTICISCGIDVAFLESTSNSAIGWLLSVCSKVYPGGCSMVLQQLLRDIIERDPVLHIDGLQRMDWVGCF